MLWGLTLVDLCFVVFPIGVRLSLQLIPKPKEICNKSCDDWNAVASRYIRKLHLPRGMGTGTHSLTTSIW